MLLAVVRSLAAERRDGRPRAYGVPAGPLRNYRTAEHAIVFASPTTDPASNGSAGAGGREGMEAVHV